MNKLTIYIALGSNYFNRLEYLRLAISLLARNSQITIKKLSSIYFNKAIDLDEENAFEFANAVCLIETYLSPMALFNYCQYIELNLGRKLKQNNLTLSRPIDLDLLIIEEIASLKILSSHNSKQIKLQIPHPRAFERDFVIFPLAEIINKTWKHPITGENIETLKQNFLKSSGQKPLIQRLKLELP